MFYLVCIYCCSDLPSSFFLTLTMSSFKCSLFKLSYILFFCVFFSSIYIDPLYDKIYVQYIHLKASFMQLTFKAKISQQIYCCKKARRKIARHLSAVLRPISHQEIFVYNISYNPTYSKRERFQDKEAFQGQIQICNLLKYQNKSKETQEYNCRRFLLQQILEEKNVFCEI